MRVYLRIAVICLVLMVISGIRLYTYDDYEYNKYLYTLEYEIREYGFYDAENDIYYGNMNRNEYTKMLRCWEEGGDVSTIDVDWDAIEIIEKSYKH